MGGKTVNELYFLSETSILSQKEYVINMAGSHYYENPKIRKALLKSQLGLNPDINW